MSKKPTIVLRTPIFRGSYPKVISPTEYKDKGKPTGKWSWNIEGIFDEPDLLKFIMIDDAGKGQLVDLTIVLKQLALTAWPDLPPFIDPTEPESPSNPRLDPVVALFKRQQGKGWPIKKGDAIKAALELKQKKGDQYAGKRVINMKSNKGENTQPPILSIALPNNQWKALDRDSEKDMETAKAKFVGGNYFFAAISVVADIYGGMNFLTPYLNSIRYIKEGAKFGQGNAMDRFDGITGGRADYDPTQGMTADSVVDL
jgi:hypothetical protein